MARAADASAGFGASSSTTVEPDRVAYEVFGTLPRRAGACDADDDVLEALEACRVACAAHLAPFLEGYVWQRDAFRLEIVAAEGGSRGVPARLAGATRFGDCVDDEWFIVWLLHELTRAFPTLVARVLDNDGEFLLIECAYHLPRWVKPESVANRAWIRGGRFHLVPPSADASVGAWARPDVPEGGAASGGAKLDATGGITVEAALWLVRGGDGADPDALRATLAPAEALRAVDARIAGYPEKASENRHDAFAIIPARLARLLDDPGGVGRSLVPRAIEAFYHRDPISMRAAAKRCSFPPEDLAPAIVVCTRCSYAMALGQKFEAPRGWPMPSPTDRAAFAGAELGLKIATGFEMLAAELGMDRIEGKGVDIGGDTRAACIAESVAALPARDVPPSKDPSWEKFLASLSRNGYFRDEMVGSARYKALLVSAVREYGRTNENKKQRTILARSGGETETHGGEGLGGSSERLSDAFRLAAALAAADARAHLPLPPVDPNDAHSDAWMREVPEALERELETREAERAGKAGASHAHKTAANDPDALADVAYRLRSFLYERSGHEGAGDTLGVGAEDDLLDASRFLSELSEALRVNTVSRGSGKGNALGGGTYTDSDDDFSDDDETSSEDDSDADEGVAASASRCGGMEERTDGGSASHEEDDWSHGAFGEAYARAMRRELRGSAVAAPFEGRGAGDEAAGCEGDEEGMAKIRDRGRDASGRSEVAGAARRGEGEARREGEDQSDVTDEFDAGSNEDLDVDLNLVQNMLESYREQAGAAGPASQLLASVGAGVTFGDVGAIE